MVFVFPVDEDQLRAKGYDKTPDFILQVPVGKSLNSIMYLFIKKDVFFIDFFVVVTEVHYLYNTISKWVKLLENIILK